MTRGCQFAVVALMQLLKDQRANRVARESWAGTTSPPHATDAPRTAIDPANFPFFRSRTHPHRPQQPVLAREPERAVLIPRKIADEASVDGEDLNLLGDMPDPHRAVE